MKEKYGWWLVGGLSLFIILVLGDIVIPNSPQGLHTAIKNNAPQDLHTVNKKPAQIPKNVLPLISNLPLPAQELLKEMPTKAPGSSCYNDFSDAMDTITGHKQLVGSGEYTGKITVKNGPYRSHYIFWKVHVLPTGPLACSSSQLVEMMSSSSYYLEFHPIGKCKDYGWKTLKFKVSHDGDEIAYPYIADSLYDLGRNVGNKLFLAIKAAPNNCH